MTFADFPELAAFTYIELNVLSVNGLLVTDAFKETHLKSFWTVV